MAYEPKTWQCGEVVSADALNHMEQGIAEASEGGGGCDCGYECTEALVELFNGSLTTTSQGGLSGAFFNPSQPIEGESVVVTLNGTDYTLPKVTTPYSTVYGEVDANNNPVFTNYPCAVMIFNGQNGFITPSEGTYQVVISKSGLQAEVSECFTMAVQKVVGSPLKYVKDDPSDHGGVVENLISGTTVDGTQVQQSNSATGAFSHAEGGGIGSEYGQIRYYRTTASGMGSHAEGAETAASGTYSHAEGNATTASGFFSHAEGGGAKANGRGSHAEGHYTKASGDYSHAEGMYTEAASEAQHVLGKYNIVESGNAYAEIVGNGTSTNPSNARTLDWNGNEVLQGSLTLGDGTADRTTITAAQLKALLAMLNA